MGDIDLRHEIQFDNDSGVAYRWREPRRARRMYSARIETCSTAKTIAWYQGPNAEQEWNEDIAMHSWIRHPNIVQLYGVASTNSMYAAVFHDDLIPYDQAVDIHRNSPILCNYFRAYWSTEFIEVNKYLSYIFQRMVDRDGCTLWIRGSNHRLCVSDMILNDHTNRSYYYMSYVDYWRPGREEAEIMSYTGPNHEAVAVFSLGLSQYHKILAQYNSSTRAVCLSFHASATATIGMVVKDQHPGVVNIALAPTLEVGDISPSQAYFLAWWGAEPSYPFVDGHLMPNLWRRYNLHRIFSTPSIHGDREISCSFRSFDYLEPWLSQANHIFSSLQIRADHDQYALLHSVYFSWILSPATSSHFPSQGWLFLCPAAQLRSGPCSFRWPDCAAYWSYDPFGAQRLSRQEAEEAGFPLIELRMWASGKLWDSTDYAGLRRFHEAKGFAPDSQEIARHLGHPLYQLCDELAGETPFAHGKLSFFPNQWSTDVLDRKSTVKRQRSFSTRQKF
ncbi:hypothetical protein C8R47DRAFT_1053935 [Mycena vitilis]|nr:hypothetical protein C8R47DRAFT_1053935 [Mycena vitilis]